MARTAAIHRPSREIAASPQAQQRSVVITSPRKPSLKDGFGGLGEHPANVAGNVARVLRGLCQLSHWMRA
jgi:hypothetical protein